MTHVMVKIHIDETRNKHGALEKIITSTFDEARVYGCRTEIVRDPPPTRPMETE